MFFLKENEVSLKMSRARLWMAWSARRPWGPLKCFEQRSNLTRAYDNYSVHVHQNELGKGAAGERESVKR